MRPGKDLTGKMIISVTDGRLIGNVKDLYLDESLDWMNGIYTGSEGLLKRKSHLIRREDVVVFGVDAILVRDADVITDDKVHPEVDSWLRLDKLRGREVNTPGGTRVGTIGDIILGSEGEITGFTLARVFVEGPIAEWSTIPRNTLVDTGGLDGAITIDLPKVEQLYREQKQQNNEREA